MQKLLIAGLLLLTGCLKDDKMGYFYVASTSCGYKVASDAVMQATRYYTACITVDEAKAIADKLNRDLPKETKNETW